MSVTPIPTDHAAAWRVPVPGAIKTYGTKAIALRDELNRLLDEVFGG